MSRVRASPAIGWPSATTVDLLRAGSGAVLATVVAATAVVAGPHTGFDPALALLFAVVVGGAVGGVRGGIAALAVAVVASVVYYAQPPLAGTPGNTARVVLLLTASVACAWFGGALRDGTEQRRMRARLRLGVAERYAAFAGALAEAQDDTLADTIVRKGAELARADMAVLTVLDPRSGRHIVRAVHGTAAKAIGIQVLPGVGITGQALRDRRLVVVGGRPGESTGDMLTRLVAQLPSRRMRAGPSLPAATAQPMAAVPALNGGRVAATLTVGRAATGGTFDERDRMALAMAAPTLALTILNYLLRRQVKEASLRDPLTGLYNRSYLDAALEQLLALRRRIPVRERRPLSVILFDLDEFRSFNELHGRKAGDAVLRAISALLRGRFRQSDLLARISGDGFLVVLDGADAEVCALAAAEIRRQVQQLALSDERGVPLQASISAGSVTFREETERPDAIIRAAEAALQTARWSGPGAIVAI